MLEGSAFDVLALAVLALAVLEGLAFDVLALAVLAGLVLLVLPPFCATFGGRESGMAVKSISETTEVFRELHLELPFRLVLLLFFFFFF